MTRQTDQSDVASREEDTGARFRRLTERVCSRAHTEPRMSARMFLLLLHHLLRGGHEKSELLGVGAYRESVTAPCMSDLGTTQTHVGTSRKLPEISVGNYSAVRPFVRSFGARTLYACSSVGGCNSTRNKRESRRRTTGLFCTHKLRGARSIVFGVPDRVRDRKREERALSARPLQFRTTYDVGDVYIVRR